MPRKTKKQKVIAAYRHKLKQLQPALPVIRMEHRTAAGNRIPEREDDSGLKQWLGKELRRTGLVTVAIIVLEFLIFYAKLKGIYRF